MKNTIENLVISLIVFIIGSFTGAFLMHKGNVSMMDKMMKHQNEVTIQAINKNTTEVINQSLTEIKKLKLKNSELTNVSDDEIKPLIQTSIDKPEKKRFNLFNRN